MTMCRSFIGNSLHLAFFLFLEVRPLLGISLVQIYQFASEVLHLQEIPTDLLTSQPLYLAESGLGR